VKSKIKLPDNHRRGLSVTAQMVEQTLDEMEALLRSRGNGKLTSKIESTYSENDRQRLLIAISEMRQANAEMFRELNLEPSHYTEDHIITAKNTHMWTILVDSTSQGLRGFGDLSPAMIEAVDLHIKRLLRLLKEIS
jgi:hypothetical protein